MSQFCFGTHLLPALASAVLLSAAQSDEKPALPRTPLDGAELAHETYEWDGRGERHLVPDSPWSDLPLGEAPRVPGTVFYASANVDAHPEVRGAEGPVLLGTGYSTDDGGRFGRSLKAELARSGIEYSLTAPIGPQFTLSFWIRPRTAGRVLDLPGVGSLVLDKQFRLKLRLTQGENEGGELAPVRWRARAPLPTGEWTLVGLIVDSVTFQRAAIVIGSTAFGKAIPEVIPSLADRVVLGTTRAGLASFTGEIDDLRIVARALNSSEIVELADTNTRAGFHSLDLRTADSAESYSEVWINPLTTPRIEDADSWESGDREHLAAGPEGLHWVEGQWRRDDPPVEPRARTTQPSVFVGDHTAFLFSGEVRDSHVGPMRCVPDTWLYDLEKRAWESVDSEPAPPGRVHQMAAYSPDHDVVLIHGGWVNDGDHSKVLDDSWLFHVRQRRWSKVAPQVPRVMRSSDAPIVYDPVAKRFALFVGNTVSTFDPAVERWSPTPEAAIEFEDEPIPGWWLAASGSAGYDPVHKQFVFFGGQHGGSRDSYTNQTVHYDPARHAYRVMAPSVRPKPRGRGAFAYQDTQRRFVLFGGVLDQRSTRMRDLWAYDPDKGEWTPLESADTPSRRGGFYNMVYDPELDEFALLCGRHSVRRFLSEVWRLKLDPDATARVSYVFDRRPFADLSTFDVRWERSALADITLRFRSSRDGLAWGEWSSDPRAAWSEDHRFCQVELTGHNAGGSSPLRVRELGFSSEPAIELDALQGVSFDLRPE